MRFGRARRDAKVRRQLLVRAAERDELHDLALPLRKPGLRIGGGSCHAGEGTPVAPGRPLAEGSIRERDEGYTRAVAARYSPRTNEASCPRWFTSASSSWVSAPICRSRSSSSRRCVCIISGPSVAI